MREQLSGSAPRDGEARRRGFGGSRALAGAAVFAALAVAVGCAANSSNNNTGQFADAGLHPDARPEGGADAPPMRTIDGGTGPDGGVSANGPIVKVVDPTAPATGDYSSDAIVTSRVLHVVCSAKANPMTGDPVDATSVVATATAGAGTASAAAEPTGTGDQFQADLTLDGFSNGALTVGCTAADTSSAARKGAAEISTYLDLGPRIAVFSPVANAPYAKQVDVSFQVTAAPVAPDDTAAAPDPSSVEVDVAGTKLPGVTGDSKTGIYTGTITFDDPFSPPLDGPINVVVRAADKRQKNPVERETSVVFVADSTGPAITIQSPAPGDLISGIFTLTAKITDPAGVDPASVVATIAGTHQFALTEPGTDTYAGSFDTRQLGTDLVFPTIIVRARDTVGNQSSRGESVALDNRAPLASLDPPQMREAKIDTATGNLLCSRKFDPLGGADNDGFTVPQLSQIRARVEDRGNDALSSPGIIVPEAGVDPDNVQLFILDNSDGALLVDTDGDGVCDAINPLLIPTSTPSASNEAAVINLAPLSPTGDSDFDPNDLTTPFQTTGPESQCNAGTDQNPPAPVCQQSAGTRIIATEFGGDPAIFTIPPAGGDQCWGTAFDSVATNISDGFACLAVRAADKLGNVGISPPLRLCFDSTGSGACSAPIGQPNATLPDCTGTYDPTTNTVDTSTPCTPPASFHNDPTLQLRRIDL